MSIENTDKTNTLVRESAIIKKLDDYAISDDCLVKVTHMGNVTEVMYMERVNHKATIQRLDKTHYMIISTGEVFEVEEGTSRATSFNSLYQTFRRLRNLINTNVSKVENVRWITLTYRENMTDTVKLYEDFKKFIMRFKTYCKKKDLKKFEYIVAMEPQGRGAWHAHLLLIWDSKAPYIPNQDLADVWGLGFVKIKALDDIDNIGAYLTAYLGDMEAQEAIESNNMGTGKCKVVETENGTKAYIKGARLVMYPPGFNLYRTSRGIELPREEYKTYGEIKKASVGALTYKTSIAIEDKANDYNNTICKEYYNSKR